MFNNAASYDDVNYIINDKADKLQPRRIKYIVTFGKEYK